MEFQFELDGCVGACGSAREVAREHGCERERSLALLTEGQPAGRPGAQVDRQSTYKYISLKKSQPLAPSVPPILFSLVPSLPPTLLSVPPSPTVQPPGWPRRAARPSPCPCATLRRPRTAALCRETGEGRGRGRGGVEGYYSEKEAGDAIRRMKSKRV